MERQPLEGLRDGIEAVWSTIYLLLTMAVAGAAGAVLVWVAMNAPFGTQGEWLYLGAGALLALLWALTKSASLIRRRHRDDRWRQPDDGPRVTLGPSGLTFELGSGTRVDSGAAPQGALTWRFESSPTMHTIRLDEQQMAAARTLHADGLTWEEIGRRINPDYDRLAPMEQAVFRHALEVALLQGPGIGAQGPAPRAQGSEIN